MYFLRDVLFTIIYFALHPLHYLFLYLPRGYDKICLLFSAIRNIIPTKSELRHTILYWIFNVLNFSVIVIRAIIKILINFCYKLVNKSKYILLQYSKL